MLKRDTLDKIVQSYFAAITTHPFTYKGVTYEPAPLRISEGLLRGFTCPAGCGGCCPTFTLDYIEGEPHPYELEERMVEFDGRQIKVWSDTQKDNKGFRCRNLIQENGRCGIHGKQPFSCDFELIRFINRKGTWYVNETFFTRKWAMKRTDGGIGAACDITPATTETALDVARRLERLCQWADYFGLQNHRGYALLEYVKTHADDPSKAKPIII